MSTLDEGTQIPENIAIPLPQKDKWNRNWFRGRKLGFGALALTLGLITGACIAVQTIRVTPAQSISMTTADIYSSAIVPGISEAPPIPTIFTASASPEELANREVGGRNFVEYFLSDVTRAFKETRRINFRNNPSFAERIDESRIESENIGVLILWTDETRERNEKGEFNGVGWGRSDVFLFAYINPRTLEIKLVNIPRDVFTPELRGFDLSDGVRLGEVTQTNYLDPSTDSFALAKQVTETITRTPVDTVMQFNMDALQGFTDEYGVPGITDRLYPGGIEVDIPQRIEDRLYPVGYRTERVVFEVGRETMDANRLTRYLRTRATINKDFDREDRQRKVALDVVKRLISDIALELVKGETPTLERLDQLLNEQASGHNLFSDINLIRILANMKNNAVDLRSNPRGVATLALLTTNSKEIVDSFLTGPVSTFAPSRISGLLVNMPENISYAGKNMLIVRGTNSNMPPTDLGNHLAYWRLMTEAVSAFL